jgi:hypothetical protein
MLPRALVIVVLVWLACVVVYIVCAPDRLPTYVILNNSGSSVTLQANGISLEVDSGGSGEIPTFDVRKLQPFFLETDEGKRIRYTWMPIGDRRFIRGHRIYWQLERDFKIYLVLPTPEGVAKELPIQPPGYPLEPGKLARRI